MPRSRSGLLRLCAGLVGGVLVSSLSVVTADAATASSPVTEGVSTTDLVGSATQYITASDLSLSSASSVMGGIHVSASDGVSVDVTPPFGVKLAPGRYHGVASTATATTAGLYVGSYQVVDGDIDVLDVAANASGALTRFDVVFRASTVNAAQNAWGEIRMGEPEVGAASFSSRHIEWPSVPVGGTTLTSRETIRNPSAAAVSVGSPSIASGATNDFVLGANSCGTSLPAGASCSVVLGFAPTAAGPRDAVLSIPVAGVAQSVTLSGSAPLGTTKLTISGSDYVDGGKAHSFTTNLVGTVGFAGQYLWTSSRPYGVATQQLAAHFDGLGGPLTPGTYATTGPDASTSSYVADVSAFSRGCGGYQGTETVKSFAVDADGEPSLANISFTQECTEAPTAVMTGTLLWRSRSDVTAPSAPSSLSVTTGTNRTVSWTASKSTDAKISIARLYVGTAANATPTAGIPLSFGTTTTAALPTLSTGHQYTVTIFAVDAAGNVSKAGSIAITG